MEEGQYKEGVRRGTEEEGQYEEAARVSGSRRAKLSRNSRPSIRLRMPCETERCELNSRPSCFAAKRNIVFNTSSPSKLIAPRVSQTIAQKL